MIEQVALGRTHVEVTRAGLGTAPLGGLYEAVAEAEAHAVVERAWELGIRFFDTAPLYGYGLAERYLGAALRARPRDELTLGTKVGRLLRADAPADPEQRFRGVPAVNPVFDFSYDATLRSLEESLERLGLDRVDVAYVHDPDDHYDDALDGAFRALEQLRDEGVVGAIGSGMNQAEMLVRFAREADPDCFLVAGRYTLLDQSALRELLPLCVERGIAVVAGGVFNSGLLAGGNAFDYVPAPPERLAQARRLAAVCERHGVPLAAAALQFPLAHEAVVSVLLGARSVGELEQSVALLRLPLPQALWEELRAERLLPDAAPVPS